jgi:hypothetical protein
MKRSESSRYEEILLRATEVEREHFQSWEKALTSAEAGAADTRRLGREGRAASVAAAALGAAQRFVHDHGSLADAELRRLDQHASRLAHVLPPELQLLFKLHYVDGYPLSVYATATEMDLGDAAGDYRDIILALSATGADWTAVLQGTASLPKRDR